jgi:hypothetical protein
VAMKTYFGILLITIALASGCSLKTTAKIATIMKEANLEYPITKVEAYPHWSTGYGKGLDVAVWIKRSPGDYARNLTAELGGAAGVLPVLAKSDLSVRWDFLEVRFFIDYGRMPPYSRKVVGVADVLIMRDKMIMLRNKPADASEYSRNWKLIVGYKDQPDTKELLKW